MEPINLRKLKRPQLIALAGHFKIKRRHRLRKRELVKRLEKLLPEISEELSLSLLQPQQVESSSRFAPPPSEQPYYVDRGAPIPLHYGRDRISAMVRDPNCLYVYWELEGPRRDEVIGQYGPDVMKDVSWILRLHSDEEDHPWNIPIVVEGCNWYLSVAEDRSYVAEIGIVARNGQFISFAMSNRVRTPRTGVSPDTTREWMRVDDDFSVVRLESRGPRLSGAFAETMAERFRTPDMSSRFLGASGRVPGSRHVRPGRGETEK